MSVCKACREGAPDWMCRCDAEEACAAAYPSREQFAAAVQEAVQALGEQAVARLCLISIPSAGRWARGESAPHPFGRQSAMDALATAVARKDI